MTQPQLLAYPLNGRAVRIGGTTRFDATAQLDSDSAMPLYGLPDLFDRATWRHPDPLRGPVQQLTALSQLLRNLPDAAPCLEEVPVLHDGEAALGPIAGRYLVARVCPGNADLTCLVTIRYAGVTGLLCAPPPRQKPYTRTYPKGWQDVALEAATSPLAEVWRAALGAMGAMVRQMARAGQFAAEGFPETGSVEAMCAALNLPLPEPKAEHDAPTRREALLGGLFYMLTTASGIAIGLTQAACAEEEPPLVQDPPALPAAATGLPADPDADLVVAWDRFRAAHGEVVRLKERYRAHLDVQADERDWSRLFHDLPRDQLSWVDEERIAPCLEELERKKAIVANDPFPQQLFDAAEQAQDAAEDLLMSTPAIGLTGAMVKLRYLQFITSVFQVRPTDPRFDEILLPLTRIAGRTMPGYGDAVSA